MSSKSVIAIEESTWRISCPSGQTGRSSSKLSFMRPVIANSVLRVAIEVPSNKAEDKAARPARPAMALARPARGAGADHAPSPHRDVIRRYLLLGPRSVTCARNFASEMQMMTGREWQKFPQIS